MNFEHINKLKAKKEGILNSKKETFTRKDLGGLYVKPTEKRTITIQIKLPKWTENRGGYIPTDILDEYYIYNHGCYGENCYFLKKSKKEEASKIRISLEVEQYFYSKEDVLDRLNEVIEGYRKAIVHSMEPLQERLARYEELLK